MVGRIRSSSGVLDLFGRSHINGNNTNTRASQKRLCFNVGFRQEGRLEPCSRGKWEMRRPSRPRTHHSSPRQGLPGHREALDTFYLQLLVFAKIEMAKYRLNQQTNRTTLPSKPLHCPGWHYETCSAVAAAMS